MRRDKRRPPRIHNYIDRSWGHDFIRIGTREDGLITLRGWGMDIRAGDFLFVATKYNGGYMRYLVEDIEYERDPPDAWVANVSVYLRTVEQVKHDVENFHKHRLDQYERWNLSLASWEDIDGVNVLSRRKDASGLISQIISRLHGIWSKIRGRKKMNNVWR